jgi:predicted nucleic acid-binding protein
VQKYGGGVLAVDTNVIVRYLTRDDPEQSPRAEALINQQTVFVSATVLLETEWVLRDAYGYEPAALLRALRLFAGLPQVTFENPMRIAQALDWTEAGLDFADALHLAGAESCEALITFDKDFARAANRLGWMNVRIPSA